MANNYTAIPDAYLAECDILTDEEFGRLVRALMRYHMTGEAIEPSGNERFFARRFMLQEDRHAEKYAELTEKKREAGRRSGAVRRAGGRGGKQSGTAANRREHGGTETNKSNDTDTGTGTGKDTGTERGTGKDTERNLP